MVPPSTRRLPAWISLGVVAGVFGLSGGAALIYQVAWQRILALHSGVGIYSVALIVAAFMAGLGLGSYWGGRLAARAGASRALLWFAALELAIGGFATLSPWLYYDLLGARGTWLYASLGRAGVVHFAALLPPTCLMGMSLPFLVQAAVHDLRVACRTIGLLYGLNILGAAAGALLTPWLLIRHVGIDGAIQVGAAANVTAGLLSLWLWKLRALEPAEASGSPLESPGSAAATTATIPPGRTQGLGSFAWWMALYALSGFFALALELVWFRVIDVAVRSTAFTFGSVLAIYLLGLGIGCLWGGSLALKVRSPLRVFLVCQTALMFYTGAAALLLVRLPVDLPAYRELVRYWISADVFELGRDGNWGRISLLYLALPTLLYGPPTVLMGVSFAVLQKGVHNDRQTTGRKVGFLQTANIVGNVAGSLLVGLVLLEYFGTPVTLRLLLGAGLLFPILGLCWLGLDRALLCGTLLLAGVVAWWPSTDEFWSRLHGVAPAYGRYAEDASGLMAITPAPLYEGHALRVSMNGKWQSWLPFGGSHSELGGTAALIHPAPAEIALIGLGSGDTAWAAGCRADTSRITVYEICAAEQRLLQDFAPKVPELGRFLSDPRVTILAEDGRRSLARSPAQFDLIEADALRPQSAYAGNIYSVEFFRLCASRLKPGGMMCQWGPTPRVRATFCEAFPHVLEVPGKEILIGSNDPIAVDLPRWLERLDSPHVQQYLGGPIANGLRECLLRTQPVSREGLTGTSLNRDLFPRDEFASPE
jgi:spermidine synthase